MNGEQMQSGAGGGLVLRYRRVGGAMVRLDGRCGTCAQVPASPPEELAGATAYPYPARSSLMREYLPAVHDRQVHGGGPVGAALAELAVAIPQPQLIIPPR